MRAYTITKTRRARPKVWLGVLALALAVGSLAAAPTAGADGTPAGSMLTPGTPGGYSGAPVQKGDIGVPASHTSVNSVTGAPAGSMLTPGTPGGYSGAPVQKGDIGVLASDTTLASGSPADKDDGFDWLSAAIGGAAAMALVALGGAAFLTVRRRTAVSPSTASTS
jgi:hypothetical protein